MPITMGMLAGIGSVPLVAAYHSATTSASTASSLSGLGMDIGTPDENRYIAVLGWHNDGGNPTIDTCTVGGVSMTRVARTGTNAQLALFISPSPIASGATANVAMYWSGNASNRALAVFSITGPVNVTPAGTLTAAGNIAVGNGGVIIAGANNRNSITAVTFSGLTEVADNAVASSHRFAGALHNSAAAESRAVGAGAVTTFLAVSFNPQ